MFLSSREFGTMLSAWLEKGDKAPSVVEGFHGSQRNVSSKRKQSGSIRPLGCGLRVLKHLRIPLQNARNKREQKNTLGEKSRLLDLVRWIHVKILWVLEKTECLVWFQSEKGTSVFMAVSAENGDPCG